MKKIYKIVKKYKKEYIGSFLVCIIIMFIIFCNKLGTNNLLPIAFIIGICIGAVELFIKYKVRENHCTADVVILIVTLIIWIITTKLL